MSLLKTNEIQNYNGSSLTLTASTVSTSAQLNTGGNISVTGSLNVSDDSTTRTNLGLGSMATQNANAVTITGGTINTVQPASGQSLTIKDEDGNTAITIGTDNTAASYLSLNFGSHTSGTGTLTANTLSDYEEGTWSPSLTAATSGTITVNSTNSTCWYIKIGRVVHFGGRINTSAVSSPTGDLYLEGFPFSSATVANGLNSISFSVVFTGLGVALNGSISVFWVPGDNKSRLRDGGNSTGSGGTIANHIDASTTMYISGSYLVD